MRRAFMVALRMTVVTVVVTGVLYPLAVWAVSSLAFPFQAGGSLVSANGAVVGSRLIGQTFTSAKYFHPRPSAAGTGYDATASSASNLGPTSKTLISAVETRVADVVATDPGAVKGQVPVDMVTASGSGLDPDISPDNAYLQVARVAAARGLSDQAVRDLVTTQVAGRMFGVLGEPRVNVLELNLALDRIKG
jgi:potassium-transporting ATPase KdpC subunit